MIVQLTGLCSELGSVLAARAAEPSSHICHFPVKAESCHADPASLALGCVSHSPQLPLS